MNKCRPTNPPHAAEASFAKPRKEAHTVTVWASTHRRPGADGSRPAFSLIELLVVVSIIAILVGLVVVASSQRRGPEALTRVVVAAAKGIADEFEVSSGQIVNHTNETTGLYDWSVARRKNMDPDTGRFDFGDPDGDNGMGTPDNTIERFCWAVSQNETCLQMLKSLGEDCFIDSDNDGFVELVDGWENMLEYRKSSTTGDSLPPYPRPFFASRGNDAAWGNYSSNPSSPDLEDNIYSFEVD